MVNPLAAINARVATTFFGFKWMFTGASGRLRLEPPNTFTHKCGMNIHHPMDIPLMASDWNKNVPHYIESNNAAFELLKQIRFVSGNLSWVTKGLGSGLWSCTLFVGSSHQKEDHPFLQVSQAEHPDMSVAIVSALLLETKDFKYELEPSDKQRNWQQIVLNGMKVFFYDPLQLTKNLRGEYEVQQLHNEQSNDMLRR